MEDLEEKEIWPLIVGYVTGDYIAFLDLWAKLVMGDDKLSANGDTEHVFKTLVSKN